jgi:hypothetical protein
MEIIRSICEEEKVEEEKHTNHFEFVAASFVNFINTILSRYPLIVQTDLLKRCVEADVKAEGFIDNIEELVELVSELVNAKYHDLFHKILMHNKITVSQFRAQVNNIATIATNLNILVKENNPEAEITVVVFIDEFNTTSVMGPIKEVLMDHTLDGKKLPENIFWVAAMNPAVDITNKEQADKYGFSADFSEQNNFAGIASNNQVFTVRHIPPSLDELVLDFKVTAPYTQN